MIYCCSYEREYNNSLNSKHCCKSEANASDSQQRFEAIARVLHNNIMQLP